MPFSNFYNSVNMNLPVPTVSVDPGPDYANNINASLQLIDSHNHSSGQGVQIGVSGININADFAMHTNNIIGILSTRFVSQLTTLSGGSDLNCAYAVLGDLYYNDGAGNKIQITQNGGIAGSPGSISNLTPPASASYVSANQTFVWQSDANTPANMDAGSYIFRNIVANSKGLTLNPPSAMASDFALTLPTIPGVKNIVTLDTSGNFGAALNVDNSTLQINVNTLLVKDAGITQQKINQRSISNPASIGAVARSGSATFGTFNTSDTLVTNLDVTITTNGNPIWVGLISDTSGIGSSIGVQLTSPSTQATGNFKIVNTSVSNPIAFHNVQINGSSADLISQVPSSSLNALDFQPAGTYQYQVYISAGGGGSAFASVTHTVLVAYEIK